MDSTKCFVLIMPLIHFGASSVSSLKEGRIINGDPANIEDHPYVALIYYPVDYYCTGSIVSKYNVITAAHCVEYEKEKYLLIVGTSTFTEGSNTSIGHHFDSVTKHQNFSVDPAYLKSFNDLAVIRVKESFVYSTTIQPISLFEPKEEVEPLTKAIAAGWGIIETNKLPEQFRKLDMLMVDRQNCNEAVISWAKEKPGVDSNGLAEGQICASSEFPNRMFLCDGDSGGPLVVNEKLAGVAIYGGGCEIFNSPTVYAEVAYFRDWIDQYVTYD